ncbi:right-handed parallel beta-helix repeat-containing protein [Phycisphaerales bacterium AB-hyl4]|uniref:Right-handed parallel beta-helix repeat-containing protein n=1 Tax=Natronomicrosphaera hydrolytica TaxID=3242702 RepID=A0ABV4U5S6_9BACT
MRKHDYQDAEQYEPAEWRHTLSFLSCRNVTIEGLRLENSGGDGIYFGVSGAVRFLGTDRASEAAKPYNENIVIRDVIADGHHRQGMSVISAIDMLVEDSVFKNTSGTAPAAGIDFEPNAPTDRLENIVVRNTVLDNNEGHGLLIYLNKMSRDTEPISIRVENVHVKNSGTYGISIGALKDDGPTGTIEFVDCLIERTAKAGAYIYDKAAERIDLRFINCTWRDVARGNVISPRIRPERMAPYPITVHLPRPAFLAGTHYYGGVTFENCVIEDSRDRPAVRAYANSGDLVPSNIQGNIKVNNRFGVRYDVAEGATNIDLELSASD